MESEKSQQVVRVPMRLFAGLLALPGTLVGTICLLGCIHHATFQLVEWAAISLATALFFGLIAVRGRQP